MDAKDDTAAGMTIMGNDPLGDAKLRRSGSDVDVIDHSGDWFLYKWAPGGGFSGIGGGGGGPTQSGRGTGGRGGDDGDPYYNQQSRGTLEYLAVHGNEDASAELARRDGKVWNSRAGAEVTEGEWVAAGGDASTINPNPKASNHFFSGAWVNANTNVSSWWASNASQGWLNAAGTATDVAGGLYGAAEKLVVNGDQWLGKNGKYYSTDWGGNRFTGSRAGAFEAAGMYKWAGRATLGVGVVIGGLQVYGGYQQDGGQFGYHAQTAAAGATGGLIGGWGGADAGAVIGGIIGGAFGGVGAIPGAAIGGFIGGYFGSQAGSAIGSGAVNYYYDHR